MTNPIATEGKDVEMISEVLEEVEDWEALAGWLDINSNMILQDCASPAIARCYRRKLVKIYIDRLTYDDKCVVASNIASALEKMKMMRQARILQQLYTGE